MFKIFHPMLEVTARGLALVALLLMAFQLSACDSADDNDPDLDIVGVAQEAEFNTLVTALQAAGLVETLQGEGPFTVFAPTDAAFAALPEGTVESLLQPENRDQLVGILTYHVVPGRVTAAEAATLDQATTVQGGVLDISTEGSAVFINGARVTTPNVEATNGIIHVIDEVLLPSQPAQ